MSKNGCEPARASSDDTTPPSAAPTSAITTNAAHKMTDVRGVPVCCSITADARTRGVGRTLIAHSPWFRRASRACPSYGASAAYGCRYAHAQRLQYTVVGVCRGWARACRFADGSWRYFSAGRRRVGARRNRECKQRANSSGHGKTRVLHHNARCSICAQVTRCCTMWSQVRGRKTPHRDRLVALSRAALLRSRSACRAC